MFAMTYPQLMNQAIRAGFNEKDLTSLRKAYEFAECLFDGFYRAQRTPFINHLVRTASIVMNEKKDMDLAIASLLHAVYEIGQFSDGIEGKETETHRTIVRAVAGASAEDLIYQYQKLPWHCVEGIPTHLKNLDLYDSSLRSVILIRLANELEDHLDLAMSYRGNYPYREFIELYGKQQIEMANGLGLSEIASQLEFNFNQHLNVLIPVAAKWNNNKNFIEHPERIWQKKRTTDRIKTIIGKKIKSFVGKSSSNDLGRAKLSYDSNQIFHEFDFTKDRELIEAVENCLAAIKKLKDNPSSLNFKPDPDASFKVSEEALKQFVEAGEIIDNVSSKRNLTNCVVFNASKLTDTVVNQEIMELRQKVDRIVGQRIDNIFYDENDLFTQNSGHFMYPPGGYMGWHTNSGSPGWRLYINYAEQPGKSFFRYRDPETGKIVTCWDKKWNFRLFRIDQAKLLWHSVYSDTNRYSFGFRITLHKKSDLPKRVVRRIKNLVGV
jgi:hypothetical protein